MIGNRAGSENALEVETARLRLRQWSERDFEPFAEINADHRVMEFFPSVLSRAESHAMAQKCQALIAERGWGFWAAECKASGQFIGFIGLHIPSPELPFAPCVEVGWRLGYSYWGKGYATEGARAALQAAFGYLNETQVMSFAAVRNVRSRAVMQRLGMREVGVFDHPHLPEKSGLRQHCLYRLSVAEYDAQPRVAADGIRRAGPAGSRR